MSSLPASLGNSRESSSLKKREEKDSIVNQFLKYNNCSFKYTIPSDLEMFLRYNCYKTKCSYCNGDVSILKVYIYNNKCYCLECARFLKSKGNDIFYSWIKECEMGRKCSNCKRNYPCFCYIDDYYVETDKCLICRNEEDLLVKLKDEKLYKEMQLYKEYLENGKDVNCRICNNVCKKTSVYGSYIEFKTNDDIYQRDGKYYCFECILKVLIEKYDKKEKKDKFHINLKRVFDDEDRGVKECGKCNRYYPEWHYITTMKKELIDTKTCLECRNKEKVTKKFGKIKTEFKKAHPI